MRSYVADLHIHTCLSPCGELTMAPRAIVDEAIRKGIDLIAVADHNTAAMNGAVAQAAAERGLFYLYGMELQTREEVHLLAYFDTSDACLAFSDEVYSFLPKKENVPEYFGDQVIVDVDETILGVEPRLLLNSLDLSFEDAVERIRAHGGLPVPAHVDRATFGLIAQLGFAPEGVDFALVEAVGGALPASFGAAALLCTSDAHELEQIGRRTTTFWVESPTVRELVQAAEGIDGRSMVCSMTERRLV